MCSRRSRRRTPRSAPTTFSRVLAEKGTRLAPISVYRAIDALLEAGVIHRLESKNAFFACRRLDHTAGRRPIFLACEKCNAVQEVDCGRHLRDDRSRLARHLVPAARKVRRGLRIVPQLRFEKGLKADGRSGRASGRGPQRMRAAMTQTRPRRDLTQALRRTTQHESRPDSLASLRSRRSDFGSRARRCSQRPRASDGIDLDIAQREIVTHHRSQRRRQDDAGARAARARAARSRRGPPAQGIAHRLRAAALRRRCGHSDDGGALPDARRRSVPRGHRRDPR